MKMWVGNTVIRKDNTQMSFFKGVIMEKKTFGSGVSKSLATVLPYRYIFIAML